MYYDVRHRVVKDDMGFDTWNKYLAVFLVLDSTFCGLLVKDKSEADARMKDKADNYHCHVHSLHQENDGCYYVLFRAIIMLACSHYC